MLLKVLSTLLFVSLLVPTSADTACFGTELSVHGDYGVGILTDNERRCTIVYGNIVIGNLTNPKRIPNFWSVVELHGSLIIANTTNIGDSVNFQNLKKILAADEPAISLYNNRGLRLAIGASLGEVYTNHNVTYLMVNNWPSAMSRSQYLTLSLAATSERPVFYTDHFFLSSDCAESIYKAWSLFFGIFAIVAFFGLIGVAFYGRPHQKDTKIN